MPKIRRTILSVLTCAVCIIARPANAALTIIKSDGTHASAAQATKVQNLLTGEWVVTLKGLYAPGEWTLYEVHGNAGEIISDLIIDVPCWTDPSVE